jgi:hypothetical protein
MGRDDRNDHAVFADLDLFNPHPFRQRKQRCPFYHNLTLNDETIF